MGPVILKGKVTFDGFTLDTMIFITILHHQMWEKIVGPFFWQESQIWIDVVVVPFPKVGYVGSTPPGQMKGWEVGISLPFFFSITHTIHGTGRFPYMYHQNQPKVGKCTIHGWYGLRSINFISFFGVSLPSPVD